MRCLSAKLGCSASYVCHLHKRGLLKHHSNAMKPYLTEKHKENRMMFALDHIDPVTGEFDDIMSHVHLDEK